MLHSLLIAQTMGFFLLFMGIILLARAQYYKGLLASVKVCRAAVFIGSVFALILGITLVLVHNLWVWNSSIIVTILAWIVLIKSLLWLGFPDWMIELNHKLYSGYMYYVTAAIALILGIILLSHGAYIFME